MIREFRGPYRFLSNFWLCEIKVLDDEIYPSTEHAYQALKFEDKNIRKLFMDKTLFPGNAKKLGRKYLMFKSNNWDLVKLDVMYGLNLKKFSEHPNLKELLLDTGDQELVEGNNWGDTYWGAVNGAGENHLGKILMRVRNDIRDSVAIYKT